ncbi:MgtC/SapB family protein [Streptomyces sp. CBMA156]|uniref:MgtC/SapB family protein n=1 Tax=Streptomyces sp. CBMA156 TaxID=1930280 RepID=UPI001CB881B1
MRTLGAVIEPFGQGWVHFTDFGIALVLASAIGLEREIRQKAAGLRTYTVVGLGAALFTLVSKYGFSDVVRSGEVTLDPSRMAAQIVSGLGFIGAGVIFVQRGSIRGLTTAATVWLTAAIGTAAAAGLPLLATAATAAYFFVGYVLRPLTHRLPRLRARPATCRITYTAGHGLLRTLLARITAEGFTVTELAAVEPATADRPAPPGDPDDGHPDPGDSRPGGEDPGPDGRVAEVTVTLHGRGDLPALTAELARLPGVRGCAISRIDD